MTPTHLKPLLYRTFISALFVMLLYGLCYFFLDRAIILWLSHRPDWQRIATEISTFMKPKILGTLACGIIIIFVITYKRAVIKADVIKKGLTFSLSVLLAFSVTSVLKFILARYRPELFLSHHLYGFHFFSAKHAYNSTPSGHATGAFSVCYTLAMLIHRKPITYLLLTIACIVGLLRIITLHHYPSDVIFGAYIGILSFYYAQILLNCVQAKTSLLANKT